MARPAQGRSMPLESCHLLALLFAVLLVCETFFLALEVDFFRFNLGNVKFQRLLHRGVSFDALLELGNLSVEMTYPRCVAADRQCRMCGNFSTNVRSVASGGL